MPKAASSGGTRPPAPIEAVLPARVFERVRKLVYDQAGIDLRPGKEALVTARLGKRLRETGCPSFQAYVDWAAGDPSGEGLLDLIDALTTNFTAFLREPVHFEFMRDKILPALISRPRVEIWCAAAATGEEPYSIAFTLLDALSAGRAGGGGDGGIDSATAARCRVLATDISTRALERARQGVYPAERFAAVSKEWLAKYLRPGTGDAAGSYCVRPEVARIVEFRRLNLIQPLPKGLAQGGAFPLIWCRNVMIYFDAAVQQRVVAALEQSLEPGGYLFTGHAESLNGVGHALEYVRPATYRKRG